MKVSLYHVSRYCTPLYPLTLAIIATRVDHLCVHVRYVRGEGEALENNYQLFGFTYNIYYSMHTVVIFNDKNYVLRLNTLNGYVVKVFLMSGCTCT